MTKKQTAQKALTVSVPRATDRRLYAKFEVPFATGQTSASVYIPLAEVTPGTTVTLTITHDAPVTV